MKEPASGIDQLVTQLTQAETGHVFRRARQTLLRHDSNEIVRALIRAMRGASHQRSFDRAARLLAEYGGDEAAEALATEARTQRRYPRLAIRAFAQCVHPTVVPVLLDILEFGKMKQKRAAAYALARLHSPLGIEPLCKASALGEWGIGHEATEALNALGRPHQIARLALSEPIYSASDHVRVLQALSCSLLREGFWRPVPFDPKRFLNREAQDYNSGVREQAGAAAAFLEMQSTLLRSGDALCTDALLRAASGPGESGSDSLLRASESFRQPGAPRITLLSLLVVLLRMLFRKS